ncbi:MAG: hypothetical protein IAE87_17425 [Rhodobacteraceae bacterium]|jgi:hypothetical protein|nr:hypothetical protein [Paracoccaceae bacterium]
MIRNPGSAPLVHGLLVMALAICLSSGPAAAQTAEPPAATLPSDDPLLTLPFEPDPARRQISVKVESGLTSTRKLPTQELRNLRKTMLAGEEISPQGLRALAEFHDGLAAQRYVRHLVDNGGSDSDIAFFGSIAVATGRIWTLPETVAAMMRLDPATEPPERVKTYMAMIYPHAWAGNSLALQAVMMLNGKGRLFGEMSDKTRKLLDAEMQEIGDGRMELLMAMNLMRNPDVRVASADEIRHYLERAATSTVPGIAAAAGALLARLATGAWADTLAAKAAPEVQL